jgi:hypothetical protein
LHCLYEALLKKQQVTIALHLLPTDPKVQECDATMFNKHSNVCNKPILLQNKNPGKNAGETNIKDTTNGNYDKYLLAVFTNNFVSK